MRKELSIHWVLLTFSNSIIKLVLPLYLVTLGFTEGQIGTLFGTASLVLLGVLIMFFTHSDRIGRKTYLFVFGLFSAISAFLLLTFNFYLVFLVAAILLSASGRSLFVFGKIISIESFDSDKSKTYGIFMSSFAMGSLLGNLVSGRIADLFGFQATFGIAIIISLISLVPLIKIKNIKSTERSVTKNPLIYLGFLFQRMLTVAGFSVLFSFAFTLYLRNVFHLSYTLIGIIWALQGFCNMVGFSMGRFVNKKNFKGVAIIAMVLGSLGIGTITFTSNLLLTVILILFASVAIGLASTSLPHFFGRVSNKLGKDISIIEATGGSVGSGIGSFLAGALIVSFGYSYVFLASSILLFSSAMALYWLFR